MKKIILLFAGAIGSFLLLSYIDEYENLIAPFFAEERPDGRPPVKMDEDVKAAIRDFNDALTKAYLSADPSFLRGLIDARLYSHIAEEIGYLAREGKIMELRVKEVKVKKTEALSPGLLRVNTDENVALRYISFSDKKEMTTYPDARHDMLYMIVMTDGRWQVVSYETRGVSQD